ncbi:MAG: hypothetical protein ABI581_09230 [Sediminibacterium sp.]
MMYLKKLLVLAICFYAGVSCIHAQLPARRLDTTMKVGKAGYRVTCNNKNPDKNNITINPIGFEKDVREFSFEIKGRIGVAEVDDMNRDGFPDLVLYVVSNDSIPKGTVIGIASEKNETVTPISLPDIFNDPKLRVGYKGNDVFFLMEGYLMRRFPVFPTEGGPPAPATGTLIRQIQYQVIPEERGGYKFKPMRSYDFTKP